MEQEAYRQGIKEYYFIKYLAGKADLRRNTIYAVSFAVVGLLILLLCYLIDARFGNPYWTEVADIASWVFVWEAVHLSVIGSVELRKQLRRSLALMAMEIEFIPLHAGQKTGK